MDKDRCPISFCPIKRTDEDCEIVNECGLIRAYNLGISEAVDEVKGLAQHYLIGMMDLENATKYGNKNAKQQDMSYGTLMRYEIADCVDGFLDSVEMLKEQKN